MKAIAARAPGGPEQLKLIDLPNPEPGPGELLVRVRATAVNRADVLQRRGHYPPPPGASDVLGDGVTGWSVGDEVCALLPDLAPSSTALGSQLAQPAAFLRMSGKVAAQLRCRPARLHLSSGSGGKVHPAIKARTVAYGLSSIF